MSRDRLSLNKSLWICGGFRCREILYPRAETAALRERGANVFLFEGRKDEKNFEELRRILKSDVHVILMWLRPSDLKEIFPLLRDRKNFSIIIDDWWIIPQWFSREASYIINRMYNGVAVRLGESNFVTASPPIFVKPEPISPYALASAALRFPALAISPFVDFSRAQKKRAEKFQPERLLYLPYSIVPASLPLADEKIQFDFTLTGSTVGVWLMRDIYSSFRHAFANLYYDRQRLMNLISQFDSAFKIYDWRKISGGHPPVSWEDYTKLIRQSRYVIASGGLHNAALPKHLEYACLGVPMIGPNTIFEYPWLDECLVEVDALNVQSGQIKSILEQAMARHPQLRDNCLKWRERLFKLFDFHCLLDMLQAQADGERIPSDYLRAGIKQPADFIKSGVTKS